MAVFEGNIAVSAAAPDPELQNNEESAALDIDVRAHIWTVLPHNGLNHLGLWFIGLSSYMMAPNHLGAWFIGLSSHMMALITSGCGSLDCPPT